MGNRGCLPDCQEQIRRQFQGQRWIICLLEFKGRKRSMMTPGQYTELFFFDEATVPWQPDIGHTLNANENAYLVLIIGLWEMVMAYIGLI